MQQNIFDRFRTIAYEKAGISLGEQKKELVAARVAKRQRALNIPEIGEYLKYLESSSNGNELVHFLDAISTNFTHFMREKSHFELLDEELRAWKMQGQRRLRIWCAASSSGEEPYSLAITVSEVLGTPVPDVRILATDINTKVLNKAALGEYTGQALEVLLPAQRKNYFEQISRNGTQESIYRVKQKLREMVVFKRLNLAHPPYPMKGPIDYVFCRNVMIYFDRAVRQRLISDIERLLAPGGLLIIGHSETLAGVNTALKAVRPSVYRKVN